MDLLDIFDLPLIKFVNLLVAPIAMLGVILVIVGIFPDYYAWYFFAAAILPVLIEFYINRQKEKDKLYCKENYY